MRGEYNVSQSALTTLAAVTERASLYTEAHIEVVSWGFVINVAGAWGTLPFIARLTSRNMSLGDIINLGGKTISSGLSPAIGSVLRVSPSQRIVVPPGRICTVTIDQAGTPTNGAGAAFIVWRRLSFHPDLQTNDIEVGV
jgi:hypothetical protein